jgi:hypothetical protein
MNLLLRTRIPRWWVISVLASILAVSSIVLSSSPTFAATGPCNPSTPLDASGGSASCTMAVGAQINGGVFTLTNDATAAVPGSPFAFTPGAQTASFNFTSTVTDDRGDPNGWTLVASSSGITNGNQILPLSLTSLDPSSHCTTGTCLLSPSFTAVTPLTTSPATFLSVGATGNTVIVVGTYINKINGEFTIPAGVDSGVYTGTISISLLNTF